ncbi:LysR substrate-binding domain-containing protein, partial [Achromobacter piechaudii]
FVSNMMSLLAMLERGVGVTVLARLGVPPDSPGLAFVPLSRPRIERELGITKLAGRSLSPAAARMEEMLRAKASASARGVV